MATHDASKTIRHQAPSTARRSIVWLLSGGASPDRLRAELVRAGFSAAPARRLGMWGVRVLLSPEQEARMNAVVARVDPGARPLRDDL